MVFVRPNRAACKSCKNNPTHARKNVLKNKQKNASVASTDEEKYTSCPTVNVPYLIGDSNDKRKRTISKARCKLWTCPYCKYINREEHYNRVAAGLSVLSKRGYEFTFTTITCHEKWRGYNASLKNWRANKDKFLARYRRHVKANYAYAPEYVYIPETHEDGTIHIHGIFSGRISTRWFKDNARACGLGYMAESDELKSVLQAVNYCTKYITKQMGQEQPTKGFRRINYSRGFPVKARISSEMEWRTLRPEEAIKDAIIEGILTKNYETKFDGKIWSTDDFL